MDYARESDVLVAFKDIAKSIGATPEQVWLVYFIKHIKAIERYVRDGHVSSESIDGRIVDSMAYLHLLNAMIIDRENGNI